MKHLFLSRFSTHFHVYLFSAFLEGFGFRGLPEFTRAVGGMLQTSKPGIRDFVSSSNYIQKAGREFIRWVPLCRCLRRALLAILAVVSLFYQDLCPRAVAIAGELIGQEYRWPTKVTGHPWEWSWQQATHEIWGPPDSNTNDRRS